ncbi:MAG: bifunctional oligoribonuclease/PAP phosphatase NrnA [Marinilabiliaceae bacterium]|nr:bifunctional oligoribonuclease/PAP phosphatase NrnA [Marinilabiliaceae bacterium]
MINDKTAINSLKSYVNNAQRVVIVPHNNPDGDALGAALALCNVLKNMQKEAVVVSPNAFPDFLMWMHGADQVVIFERNRKKAKHLVEDADLVLLVDFNALSRMKNMQNIFNGVDTPRIMIDHHPYPEAETAQIQISVPEASSTCELLYNVLDAAGFSRYITKEAAECIYSGIMTDTGALNYNSGRPETYLTVAELLRMGIDKDRIHHMIFHNNSFDRMRLLGHALGEKMVLIPELKAAYIYLSSEDLQKFNFKPGDTEGFVNQALWIEGVDVSALFTEKDDLVKISFRSRGDFPVNKFSEKCFNGGGHLNAAGGESRLPLNETLERFQTKLKAFRSDL